MNNYIQIYKDVLDPDYCNDLIYRLGMILYQDGQLKKSLEYLRRYLAYEPKDIEVIKILADILYSLNRLPEAIDNYKRLIELNQQHRYYQYSLLNIFLKF